MFNLKILIDKFWFDIKNIFQRLIISLEVNTNDLNFKIGKSNNDSFPMRAFLSINRNRHGNEISVTVDVKFSGGNLIIESDICSDDGVLIAEGPSQTLVKDNGLINEEIQLWMQDFELFLDKQLTTLKNEVSRLD